MTVGAVTKETAKHTSIRLVFLIQLSSWLSLSLMIWLNLPCRTSAHMAWPKMSTNAWMDSSGTHVQNQATVYVEKETVELATYLAVLNFNDGDISLLKIFEYVDIQPGYFTWKGSQDCDRAKNKLSVKRSSEKVKAVGVISWHPTLVRHATVYAYLHQTSVKRPSEHKFTPVA